MSADRALVSLPRQRESTDNPDRRRTAAPAATLAVPVTGARWERTYPQALLLLDLVLLSVCVLVAAMLRFGTDLHAMQVQTPLLAGLLAPAWVTTLAATRAYEQRFLGVGTEEFARVLNASVRLGVVVAFVSYSLKLQISRGFVGIVLPLGTAVLLAGRYAARRRLRAHRRAGVAAHRVLVAGQRREVVRELVDRFRSDPEAGFAVVGAAVPLPVGSFREEDGLPVLGDVCDVVALARSAGADTIAAAPGMSSDVLRRMAWSLEGSGIDLVLAPTLLTVGGPHARLRPVAGLPLLHVDLPRG